MRLAALLLLAPSLAHAAIQPCIVDQLVAAAPTVVQVQRVAVDERPRGSHGLYCALTGVVAQSFRGALGPGATVAAEVPCRPFPPGMTGELTWHPPAALRAAKAVELHLEADGTAAGFGAGVVLLRGPTREPAYPRRCPDPAPGASPAP